MYNPKSPIATEFIDDEEIRDTLRYAEENKDNLELVNRLIDKTDELKGLTHREAAVLLACEDKDALERIFAQATKIKQEFYGNRIVMFAPLYLSNYCVNGCPYCCLLYTSVSNIPNRRKQNRRTAAPISRITLPKVCHTLRIF